MTLWIKNMTDELDPSMSFSEILSLESQKEHNNLDLRTSAPLFRTHFPPVLKIILQFKQTNFFERLDADRPIDNKYYGYSIESSDLSVKASPGAIGKWLNQPSSPCIFDFGPYGKVFLSATPQNQLFENSINQRVIHSLLSYALSPDLWGENGKWIRFHKDLQTLFESKNLLLSSNTGQYSLHSKAQILSNFGILGDLENECYNLVLPWTFSLKDKEKLERIIRQEF